MDGVRDQLEQAARRLAAARTEHHAATLRVDRATIRKWLGK